MKKYLNPIWSQTKRCGVYLLAPAVFLYVAAIYLILVMAE